MGTLLGAHAVSVVQSSCRRREHHPITSPFGGYSVPVLFPPRLTPWNPVRSPSSRWSRSAATPRLPMRPHLRWVCVQNGEKDRNPLRDEGNRWGKSLGHVGSEDRRDLLL